MNVTDDQCVLAFISSSVTNGDYSGHSVGGSPAGTCSASAMVIYSRVKAVHHHYRVITAGVRKNGERAGDTGRSVFRVKGTHRHGFSKVMTWVMETLTVRRYHLGNIFS